MTWRDRTHIIAKMPNRKPLDPAAKYPLPARTPPEPEMSNEEFDPLEEALHYAARLKGLTLIRTGNAYGLAEFRLTGATLDEIAAYLAADDGTNDEAPEVRRRSGLQALVKAEHAMLAELEAGRRKANNRGDDRLATEAALAEIRRRIMELSKDRQAAPGSPPRRA